MPVYALVDTCAAEFEAYTPYFYSTYGDLNEPCAGSENHDFGRRTQPHRAGH